MFRRGLVHRGQVRRSLKLVSSGRPALLERLEDRRLMAAHIVGDPHVYATIQAAVDAAAPRARIVVDAGTYNEMVTISRPVTLRGAEAGVDARTKSRDGEGETVVRGLAMTGGKRSSGFYIKSSDVTIDGFTVRDETSAQNLGAGIVMAPSIHGTHLLNNIITSNVSGVYLSNDNLRDPAVIRHNLIEYNNNPGNNNGRGIYTDGGVSGGNLTGVLIDSNSFIGNVGDGTVAPNAESAVGLEAQTAGKQSFIAITNNVMSGNGKGVLAYNVTNLAIVRNSITGSTDTLSAALRFEGNASNVLIMSNTIANNLGAGIQFSARFVGPNSRTLVRNNNIVNNAKGGIVIEAGGYTGTLDARKNYWGRKTGPTGNDVIANGVTVLTKKWLKKSSRSAPRARTPEDGDLAAALLAML